MFKKFTLTGLALIVVIGGLVFTKIAQFKAMAAAGAAMVMPPVVVTAEPARADQWEKHLSVTGSIAPFRGVTVGAEMAGKVIKIAFESGDVVKAGDLLAQLDVSIEEAQLRAAEANAALAVANLNRARELREKNTNSQADLDAAEAQAKQAAAQADSLRAVIAKKTIRAPFAGRLGLRLINLGQILKDGEPLTTLQTLDPIYVNFSLPQQRLSLVSPGVVVDVVSDAAPGLKFTGKINAISPEVDQSTRNFRVQATIANADEKLRAGMFATVTVVLPEKEKVLVVPTTAVLYAPYGDSVFVIEEKKNEKSGQMEKVLRQQIVRLGTARGDFVSVESGLKPGDLVVTTGAFKLRPNTVVTIDNKLQPEMHLAPKPKDS